MQLQSLFLFGLAGAPVALADFLVITQPPIPTSVIPNFPNTQAAQSWSSSVLSNFGLAWGLYLFGQGSGYKSTQSSIASEVQAWAATANYSIPPAVTQTDTTTTITTKPDWYTALPPDVRSYKEAQLTTMESILSNALGISQTAQVTTTSKTTGLAVRPTGAVGLGAGMAAVAGAAAVFL